MDADRGGQAHGFAVPVAVFDIDPQPLRRRAAAAADPLGGQPAPAAVADVLRRRAGRGAPLPEATRTRMSQQFGVDFSPVRVHDDAESHDVAAAVQSVAFTHGRDIYFSRGSYRPDSPAGQHVLAHELAHVAAPEPAGSGRPVVGRADDPAEARADATANRVVAQLRRSHQPQPSHEPEPAAELHPGGALRRMAVMNTDWNAATSATHTSGGAVGVMIVRDSGTPVVVKAGEDFLDEAAVAAKLLSSAAGGGHGGWTASAPDARPVGAAEAKRVKAKLDALLPDTQKQNSRTQGFLRDLDANKGVMVYGFAAGQEVKDALTKTAQTTADELTGETSLREDSISYLLMNDPGLMRTFGKAAAADILLGNSDRFVGKINLENVMVDTVQKSISLIDNVEANDAAVLRDMPGIQTGEAGFRFWAAQPRPTRIAKGEFDEIAKRVIENLGDSIRLLKIKKEEKASIVQAFQTKTPTMQKWFGKGLRDGTVAARDALKNPVALTQSVSDLTREEVMANLLARRYFLKGYKVDKAWSEGVKEARKLAATLPKAAPGRPTTPAPLAAPGRPTTPAPGAPAVPAPQRGWQPGRRWRNAVAPQPGQ